MLDIPIRGSFNMHSFLLSRYREHAPSNSAVPNGETETRASFHRIVAKPVAGYLIVQQATPILSNDSEYQAYIKVSLAAECIMLHTLPHFLDNSIIESPRDLGTGNYFGGCTLRFAASAQDGLLEHFTT